MNESQAADAKRLVELLRGYMVTEALYVVASLGIADRLEGGPRPIADLAKDAGAQEDALYRIMRALATVGVFTETAPRTFALTPVGQRLRTGAQRDMALLFGGDMYRAFEGLLEATKTGGTAFERVFGSRHFPYLDAHPEASANFDRAMAGGLISRLPVVLACDWSRARHVVDVGGGNGTLVAALLAAHPNLRATVFDRPQAAPGASQLLAARGLASRCDVVAGDFFAEVPRADAYVLARVLHDWNDDESRRILSNVAKAAEPDAVVRIVDDVVPPGDAPHPSKWIDLQMLAVTGGRERTEADWRALLASAGLRWTGAVERAGAWVVEAARS